MNIGGNDKESVMTENVKKFCDENGIVTSWPTKRHLQQEMVAYLADRFHFNTLYTEKEVNDILDGIMTLHDKCTFRRDLIENLYLKRLSNGSKYWKIHKDLDYTLETDRFLVEACEESDSPRLKEMNRSVGYIGVWCGEEHTDGDIDKCLKEGDLPPQGHREFYRLKKVVYKETSEIVGFIEFYYGYPDPATLWISTFYIEREMQDRGYGQEVITKILDVAGKYGIEDAGVGVHLKNWPALRFWFKNGFSTITGIYGDKVLASDSCSIVTLKRYLSKGESGNQ
jgi:GNAT superfamily N-acetyltransferase